MDTFELNGIRWKIEYVSPDSLELVDRTGSLRVATTDPKTLTVYLSDNLYDGMLVKVLIHELGHCTMFSFGLLDDIHLRVRPEYWIEAEEWVCNFIADYGLMIFSIAYKMLGKDAWRSIPQEIEKFIT